ncbi:DUF3164 family protein [Riemerella anatipestifer]|uniref:DUF3164 family protein n=1 Tax=Riemerella anatipestifer TaxID=34085 RepID=UPI0007EC7B39|nr:DUF3164 family protein [Riemerella anatipestifer]MBT0527103.1 DUF3164 family protein [Riemerella anatipestifer]MDR7817105.1 DUF3164 family protein [Riemerella anatipestifer]MDR7849662.1 DUF3164 family protein [Riemerella anatipestifer]MDR7880332.1 DUF3164 family protein [Riemerella anatipestifer]MDY3501719.1 DUF3164 family protein [Riemerella anatipestifer]
MKDLSNLTAEELQAELDRRNQEKSEDRRAYKELVNQELVQIIEPLKVVEMHLRESKLYVFESLKSLLDLKSKAYDVKDTQQSHTFSDDKGNTITYGFRIIDGWDDTVTAGIDKVREFISSLAKDEATGKLVHAVNQLLKKDAKGNLKASRVLELTKLAEEFNDLNFTDAVNIIRQSYKPQRSAFFIDASYTDAQGKKVNIPLSISAVDFPEGTDIDSLFPVHENYNKQ